MFPPNQTSVLDEGYTAHGVRSSALYYQITERTMELAKPKYVTTKLKDVVIESPPQLKNFKVSAHTRALAKPRETHDDVAKNQYKSNPFLVAKTALTGKATQRVLELSKPKGR